MILILSIHVHVSQKYQIRQDILIVFFTFTACSIARRFANLGMLVVSIGKSVQLLVGIGPKVERSVFVVKQKTG